MKGWIVTRETKAGSKRYHASSRKFAEGRFRSKTSQRLKDADRYLTTMVKRVQDGTYVEVQPALMGEVFDGGSSTRVRVQEGSLKPSTAKSYRSMVDEHLRPAFGLSLRPPDARDVEAWRKGIAEHIPPGRWRRSTTSTSGTAPRHPRVGATSRARYLAHDPLAGLPQLRLPRGKRRPHYEPEQVASSSSSPPRRHDDTIIKLVASQRAPARRTLRRSSGRMSRRATAGGGRLHVRRSIYQGAINTPKTEDSDRVVDVPQRLLDDLAVYKVMHPPIGDGLHLPDGDGAADRSRPWHQRAPGAAPRSRPGSSGSRSGPPRAPAHLREPAHRPGRGHPLHRRPGGHSDHQLTQDVYAHVFTRGRTDGHAANLGLRRSTPAGHVALI